ncbi:hypothetical protein O1L68_39985 [Streptomyces lydicus]|nr:hypothetical protein [Streptomyces lydicus]
MVFFCTYNELYGTVYEHRAAIPADDAEDRHAGPVREAWYGELMQQRRDEERLNAGMPYVGDITGLQVWPGRLSGLILLDKDAEPALAYPGLAHGYPRTLDVFWPRLSDEQWLLLAAAARPHAHQLATESSDEAMLRILDLATRLDVNLLPTCREIKTSDCPCRSRKSVCEHIAALIEYFARTLEREPLTLLLLGGCAPGLLCPRGRPRTPQRTALLPARQPPGPHRRRPQPLLPAPMARRP